MRVTESPAPWKLWNLLIAGNVERLKIIATSVVTNSFADALVLRSSDVSLLLDTNKWEVAAGVEFEAKKNGDGVA